MTPSCLADPVATTEPDVARASGKPLFKSFWMGGYEGADHVNGRGEVLSMNHQNRHWQQLESDYRLLAAAGIRTVRESIGWRASADGSAASSRRLRDAAQTAQRLGIQVIWTLHHYGVPPGVDILANDFPRRFADFCGRVAHTLRGCSDGATVYQPINEISFLSWAVGNTGLIHPHVGMGGQQAHDAKCNLVLAALQGCDALWSVEPGARMVHNDPLIHVVPAAGANDDTVRDAAGAEQAQYQAWDMICGRQEASLGGAPRYLDVLGVNYYHGNQWEHPSNERLHWHLGDPRRRDLADMLADLYRRYARPQFLSETGHVGAGRALWLDEVASAARRCRERGIPLEGICLYPLIDRPDWEDTRQWHHSGLWDVLPRRSARHAPDESADMPRVIDQPFAARLAWWRSRLPDVAEADAVADADTDTDTGTAPPLDHQLPSFINPTGTPMSHLVVFSHLRWDFVFQRPQHLLSRMAKQLPVVFFEEPIPNAAKSTLERLHPCEGVEVLRPHLTGPAFGFHDDHIPQLQAMLAEYLRDQGIADYWLWFYTPMAVPLAADLSPSAVVYDCMDELSAFRNAPRQLLQRESALFKMADLVFTGGHSLYESKRDRHASVHCFPSSVDAAHFAPPASTDAALAEAPRRPRLGYYGVIDERIDLPLLHALAEARSDWDITMVGPVVKIDPAALPQAPNIEWLGQRSYDELPALVAEWDVCLLPFALNESTRYISPTKTLEYLAAGKPAVSTPIRDVVRGYAGVVAIADDAQGFVLACEAALNRTAEQNAQDQLQRAQIVAGTSWDRTAREMLQLMTTHAGQAQPAVHGVTVPNLPVDEASVLARAA